jgi:acid phosphatase (class A)
MPSGQIDEQFNTAKKMNSKKRNTATMILLSVLMTGMALSCGRQDMKVPEVMTSLDKEIKEIRPGILEGYLDPEEMPNSLLLVPPPPEEGSAAWQLDMEIAEAWVDSTDEARREQATIDAELHFPEAAESFNSILRIKISEENTPHLYMIMRRSMADAGLSTYMAKNHYQRTRPFMTNGAPTCSPEDEEYLRTDGSYPSGHTAIGWAWALILTEVFPEHANEILVRGREFGISRNVCNVHWYSDVLAGRMCGAAAVARLHANADFLIDLAATKEEVDALRKP